MNLTSLYSVIDEVIYSIYRLTYSALFIVILDSVIIDLFINFCLLFSLSARMSIAVSMDNILWLLNAENMVLLSIDKKAEAAPVTKGLWTGKTARGM